MTSKNSEDSYLVVINYEDQYSIWAADREVPPGWSAVGGPRTREECLAHINEVWTDMRPRSVRERMDAARASQEP